MKFGVARDLITPDIRMGMSGYGTFYGNTFHDIHDDLYVKALWMSDGEESVLLVTLDLLFHEAGLTATIKRYAGEKYGVKPDFVVVSYTHTHSGPAIRGYDLGQHSEQYEAFLQARIFSCIDRLFLNTFEGSLSYGYVEGEWNINRRKRIDGKMQAGPNPDGLTDNRLQLLKIADAQGRIKALLLNYACHPVTLRDTLSLSGDFPGRLSQYVECEYYGCVALFFQGAGGNSRPRVTASGNRFVTRTFREVDDMSAVMAGRIRQAVSEGKFEPVGLKPAARQFDIRLELDVLPKEVFAAAAADAKLIPTSRNGAKAVCDRYEDMPDYLSLPAGFVRLSDRLVIAHMGGESCVEVKKLVEAAFPGQALLFIGYTDSTAYIPDDTILAEGGYEAGDGSFLEYAMKGKFKPGIDRAIRDAFERHIQADAEGGS